jgi:hypothetical protein
LNRDYLCKLAVSMEVRFDLTVRGLSKERFRWKTCQRLQRSILGLTFAVEQK